MQKTNAFASRYLKDDQALYLKHALDNCSNTHICMQELECGNLLLQLMHSAIVDVAGSHLDGKNTPGSYSALIVFETGEPFCGSYYMLPQYHMGLDVRQG